MARFGNPMLPSSWFEFVVDLFTGSLFDRPLRRLVGRFWSFKPVPREELPELSTAGKTLVGTIVHAHLKGVNADAGHEHGTKSIVVASHGKHIYLVPLTHNGSVGTIHLPASNYYADLAHIYRGKASWVENSGKQLRKNELKELLAALR